MKLIRLIILLGIVFVINSMTSNSSKISVSSSHQRVNRNTSYGYNGDLPSAYKVRIFFNDENYEYTHTFNGGTYQIDVAVNGSPSFLSFGKINQIICDLNCSINTDNSALTGNINIQRTLTVLGNKEESEIRKILRNNVIKIILKEIQKT